MLDLMQVILFASLVDSTTNIALGTTTMQVKSKLSEVNTDLPVPASFYVTID